MKEKITTHKMDNKPLIIKQEFEAPIELVWRAISEKELMKKWYFDIPDFKLEVGSIFHFEGGTEENRYVHICEIVEIAPPNKLKYSWTYEGHPGISFVTFELSSIGEKTKMKLTHEGLETFEHPDFKKENFQGGWNYLIHESLFKFLETGEELRYW